MSSEKSRLWQSHTRNETLGCSSSSDSHLIGTSDSDRLAACVTISRLGSDSYSRIDLSRFRLCLCRDLVHKEDNLAFWNCGSHLLHLLFDLCLHRSLLFRVVVDHCIVQSVLRGAVCQKFELYMDREDQASLYGRGHTSPMTFSFRVSSFQRGGILKWGSNLRSF